MVSLITIEFHWAGTIVRKHGLSSDPEITVSSLGKAGSHCHLHKFTPSSKVFGVHHSDTITRTVWQTAHVCLPLHFCSTTFTDNLTLAGRERCFNELVAAALSVILCRNSWEG